MKHVQFNVVNNKHNNTNNTTTTLTPLVPVTKPLVAILVPQSSNFPTSSRFTSNNTTTTTTTTFNTNNTNTISSSNNTSTTTKVNTNNTPPNNTHNKPINNILTNNNNNNNNSTSYNQTMVPFKQHTFFNTGKGSGICKGCNHTRRHASCTLGRCANCCRELLEYCGYTHHKREKESYVASHHLFMPILDEAIANDGVICGIKQRIL